MTFRLGNHFIQDRAIHPFEMLLQITRVMLRAEPDPDSWSPARITLNTPCTWIDVTTGVATEGYVSTWEIELEGEPEDYIQEESPVQETPPVSAD